MAYRQAGQETRHCSAHAVRASCGSLEKVARWNGASPYHAHDSHYLGDVRCYLSLSEASSFHWSYRRRPSFCDPSSDSCGERCSCSAWRPDHLGYSEHLCRREGHEGIGTHWNTGKQIEQRRHTRDAHHSGDRAAMSHDELSCLLSCSRGSSAVLRQSCYQ